MIRAGLCIVLLLVLPFTVYWQTVFHEYGFRDDYAHLREVREEPGKLFNFTASNGRPVYGAALEASLQPVLDVDDLPLLRLTGAVLLTACGLLLWWQLRRAGWGDFEAAAVGVGITMLPGAQVAIGWAIAWPIALAMVFALGGFAALETQLNRGGWRRIAGFAVAFVLYVLAGLTYQSSAMFIVVPLAALLLVRSDEERLGHYRWVAVHLGSLLVSLVAAFLFMKVLYAFDVFPQSSRMAEFESDPFGKLVWFVIQPVANALGLFALRDRFGTGESWFWAAVAVISALLVAGFYFGARRQTKSQRNRWLFCLLFLPFVAHSISLVASERAIGYRTIFALAGLVIVLVVYSLRGLLRRANPLRSVVYYGALASFVAVAAFSANSNAFNLIAEPQNREWALVDDVVERMKLDADTRVYIIEPTIADRSTERLFADEFGSLSADSDWVPKEMFKAALRERFRGKLPAGANYTLKMGHDLPVTAYDIVIDMRRLRQQRGPLSASASAGHSNKG